MGIFDSPTAPTPPDPIVTAGAQTGTNVATAIANSYLGNVNQITPQGNLTNNVTGNFSYTDPTTNQTFNIPRWTAQQDYFNPTEYLNQNPDVMAWARSTGQDLNTMARQHYDTYGRYEGRPESTIGATATQNNLAKLGMAKIANQQAQSLGNLLGTPFNPQAQQYGLGDIYNAYVVPGGPQMQIGDTNQYRTGYDPGGTITRDFDPGGTITRTYGPQDSFSADRSRVEQAMFERVNPQLQQDEQRLRQQLSDQGIAYGSPAYENAMRNYTNRVTDTRLGITQAGLQEQTGLMNMAAQQAGFQNAAQQQAYQQALGRAGFQNQAQAQQYGQNAAQSAFYNAAAQSQFDQAAARSQFANQSLQQLFNRNTTINNAVLGLRNQQLQEQYQLRNQPINEISALLSSSQVQAPNYINANRTTIPTTDVAGLINQNFAQQNDLFKTQTSTWNDILGGVLGASGRIGGAALSDVRAKENITPMGSVLTTKGELPIYGYDYKNDDPDEQRHVGPMAQDVERLEPKAVKTIGGKKHILLDKMGSIFGDNGGRRG